MKVRLLIKVRRRYKIERVHTTILEENVLGRYFSDSPQYRLHTIKCTYYVFGICAVRYFVNYESFRTWLFAKLYNSYYMYSRKYYN